ncbi:hypothetical protein DTO217A2_4230 [Paecilomyces variotii]|nr:hypothetical protein DTO217A2_4230 [Paecilomyces variotii]
MMVWETREPTVHSDNDKCRPKQEVGPKAAGSAHIDYDPARRRPNTDSVSDWSKHRRRGPLALSQHGEERGRAVLVGYQIVDFYGIASTTE